MHNHKLLFYFSLCFILLFSLIQNCFSFTIWPFRICKDININEKISGEYTIVNNENSTVKISIKKTSAADWFFLESCEFILKPGETKIIPYKIMLKDPNIKGELSSGIIVNQKLVKQEEAQGSAGFQTRINLPVYIMIGKTAILDYTIETMEWKGTFKKKQDFFEGYITVDTKIKNTGNVHALCEERMAITLLQQQQNIFIGEYASNRPTLIFPEKSKVITMDNKVQLKPGVYEARLFLYFGFDKDLNIDNEDLLKKEKCFNKFVKFTIDDDGQFSIIL